MLNKSLFLALLSLTSFSSAIPLISSKASFSESNFCKKWTCVFSGSTTLANIGHPNLKTFSYTLPDGAIIDVGRDMNKGGIILNNILITYTGKLAIKFINDGAKAPKYFSDLSYTLTGFRYVLDFRKDCVDNYDQSDVFFGTEHKIGSYAFGCTVGTNSQNGEPVLGFSVDKK